MAAPRLFLSGLIVMALFAVGHLGGFLQAAYAARHDPAMADLTRAMRAQQASLLGFHPSVLDFREYFSLNFSILLLLASGLGFATLGVTPDRVAAIRALSPLYVAAMTLPFGTSLYFSVAQGIVTCLAIAVLFGLAWLLA